MIPLFNMQLGEVVVGGVGAGIYGFLLFAILAVFVAGLMVGRTPEYVGKKIEAREVKLAVLAIAVLHFCGMAAWPPVPRMTMSKRLLDAIIGPLRNEKLPAGAPGAVWASAVPTASGSSAAPGSRLVSRTRPAK